MDVSPLGYARNGVFFSPALPEDQTLAAIEGELSRPSPWAYAPALEAQYESMAGEERRGRLAMGLRVAAVATLAGIAVDLVDRIAPLALILGWRLGTVLTCLAGVLLLRRLIRQWQETAVMVVCSVLLMVQTEMLGLSGPEQYADRYIMVAPLCVVALMVVTPTRLCTGITAAIAAMAAFLSVFWLVPGTLAPAENQDLPLAAFGALAVGLWNVGRNEMRRRSAFLHALRAERAAVEMNLLNAELLRLSITDPLTGLANRRHFEDEAARLWRDGFGSGVGVILIDVDHFKSFNDSVGHAAGDVCLRDVAGVVAGSLRRDDDVAARYGGEEFAVLLPRAGRDEAIIVADRLRAAVEALGLPNPGQAGRPVTISIGIAWRASVVRDEHVQDLLREADLAMYGAKAAGRNCVVIADSVRPPFECLASARAC